MSLCSNPLLVVVQDAAAAAAAVPLVAPNAASPSPDSAAALLKAYEVATAFIGKVVGIAMEEEMADDLDVSVDFVDDEDDMALGEAVTSNEIPTLSVGSASRARSHSRSERHVRRYNELRDDLRGPITGRGGSTGALRRSAKDKEVQLRSRDEGVIAHAQDVDVQVDAGIACVVGDADLEDPEVQFDNLTSSMSFVGSLFREAVNDFAFVDE